MRHKFIEIRKSAIKLCVGALELNRPLMTILGLFVHVFTHARQTIAGIENLRLSFSVAEFASCQMMANKNKCFRGKEALRKAFLTTWSLLMQTTTFADKTD